MQLIPRQMPSRYHILKSCGPDVSWSIPDLDSGGSACQLELGVRLIASIIHVEKPQHHVEIYVRHQVLCFEHLEANYLMVAEADAHPVQLKQPHHLEGKLPVCRLIDIEELLLALYRYRISYLIGKT